MKPIIVIYTPGNMSSYEVEAMAKSVRSSFLGDEFRIVVLSGCEKMDLKIFYEKDIIELDKEKLEELLSYCK